MGEFLYEGLKEGKKVRGKVSASTRGEALARLKGEDILPLRIEEVKRERSPWRREFHLRGVREEEIAFVLIQLSVLLSSGIALSRALELLASQTEDMRLASALFQIKGDVERGESVSSAFRRSGVFPDFLPEMLTAAETGENLERVFEIAGRHLETVADMKSRIIGAITYPSFVIAFSFLALLIAIKFVVPKIAGVLESLGKDLPLITKIVVTASDMLTYTLYLFPLLVVLFLKRKKLVSDVKLGYLLLKLPVVGKVGYFFNLSRFSYTLYMTLSSALPITSAYAIAVRSLTNPYLRKPLEDMSSEIERGRSLSWVLKESRLFPSLFINLIETGEGSGELERMLKLASDIYRREALRKIDLWVRMIEPLSILLIGVVVGIIVISVLLPLTEITS
ncbi:MAG TPA: type II secretion system F family protein, partial [Aquificaceae bacterium]|nr:type II secretion system F family protein [Aquificaceae bacterium]